jgi:hypothetical protein
MHYGASRRKAPLLIQQAWATQMECTYKTCRSHQSGGWSTQQRRSTFWTNGWPSSATVMKNEEVFSNTLFAWLSFRCLREGQAILLSLIAVLGGSNCMSTIIEEYTGDDAAL